MKLEDLIYNPKTDKIGHGAYGNVYLAFHQKTEQQFAVKVLTKEALKKTRDQTLLRNEIQIHR